MLLGTKNPLWKKIGARKSDMNILHPCGDTQVGSRVTGAVTLDFEGSQDLMLATTAAQEFQSNKTDGSGVL